MAAGIDAVASEESEAATVGGGDARHQREKLRKIAAVELELRGLLAGDETADLARVGFHLGGIGLDGDRLGEGADFHFERHGELGIDRELDAIQHQFLEAFGFGGDVVEADGQVGDEVIAAVVGGGGAGESGVRINGGDGDAGNQAAAGIGDLAGDFLVVGGLGGRVDGEKTDYDREYDTEYNRDSEHFNSPF